MKKRHVIITALIVPALILSILFFMLAYGNFKYGVFVGLDPEYIEKLVNYDEVVIDAYYFTKKDIDYLHKNKVTVYSYLNIGSLEDFRPYYDEYLDIALGDYENWPSEKWVDPSNSRWQNHIVYVLARDLYEKGVDGLFIDNVDVYSVYPEEKVFDGVKLVLDRLMTKYQKPVIVNGGHDFFEKAISEKMDISKLAVGVSIESVYTETDYENNIFFKRNSYQRKDILEYLRKIKSLGLNPYILEYTKNKFLNWQMRFHYTWLGYKYYISDNLELK